ncbi:MAG: ATP--cob(I)alamin adenosyltransferase [Phycisphaerae bacterium]|nr:MAG: cob(I)yrinic acid a,c-diamide adenosyltransferase [Planctomycetia bacterium]RIK67767.1 MAG: cob(I)yrinic acid a,c-diamide adenosyltransferase [Planctomycetota bacterium]GJQ26696.1 MAG: ATP--cob(I)alamin adenosyltransferase [Phycisphaerae bacterium]
MKLYTKQGDDGGTVLFDGTRVRKHDARVCAYGDVDETNAFVGVATSMVQGLVAASSGGARQDWQRLVDRLMHIQRDLFTVGAELATPIGAPHRDKVPKISEVDIARLESWIDDACAVVPPLRQFILPGGAPAASALHVCRTVCRRAERRVVALGADCPNPNVVIYLNRLSDLLFAWARCANAFSGVEDVPWHAP